MKRILGLGLLALIAVLASCGTSSSGSGSGGDVTVTVTATGASAAAYHAGSATWQVPSDPTAFSFTVSGGGAYEVAVRCGDNVKVFSFTTDDLTNFDASCAATPATITFDVSYDASGVTNAASVELYYKGAGFSPLTGNVTDTLNVSNGVAGQQDLVLVVYDNSAPPNVIAAKMYAVTAASGDVINLSGDPVTNADAVTTATFPDFSAEVPAGYTPFWMAVAVTPNETLLRAGMDTGPGGAGSEYLDFAFADRYGFIAFAENPPSIVGGIFVSASGAPTITLPSAINPSASGSPVNVTGLAIGPNLLAYTIRVDWGTAVVVNATISKAYLGSATGYTLPDLTGLSGFADTLPQSGDTVNVVVSAAESNLTLEEMANQGDADMFLLPDGASVKLAEAYLSYVLP